jgi:transposase-like protein
MAQKKKWSSSVKFEIALQAIRGEMTLNEICKRYAVSSSQVHAWKKQLLEQGEALFSNNEKAAKASKEELERQKNKLYEKIGRLTIERDFLKKSWEKFQDKDDNS